MRLLSTAVGVFVLGVVSSWSSARAAWPVVINGPLNGSDALRGVATLPSGDVVISGVIEQVDPADIFVARLAADTGAEVWRRVIDGTNHNRDAGEQVTIDGAENVYVVGTPVNNPGFTDLGIIKLNGATGETLWQSNWSGPANNGASYDGGYVVRVDGNGDVLAVGWMQRDVPGYAVDWLAIKLRGSDGQGVWSRQISSPGAYDYARAMAVDASGNLFISGQFNALNRFDFTVAKLAAATGVVQWQKSLNDGTWYSTVNDVVADNAGDVIATGTMGSNGETFTTVKFDGATGATRWKKALGFGRGDGVALDALGDVIAVGSAQMAQNVSAFTVVKYASADGAQRWIQQDPGTPAIENNLGDSALRVTVDGHGDVLVAGILDARFTVRKLAGGTGAQRWSYRIGTLGTAYGVPYRIAVDSNGHPTAVGYVDLQTGTEDDIVAVRLNGATGIPFGLGCQ